MIRSNLPLTAVVMIMDADRGTAAAYTAQTAGDAGRRVALPLYRNQHTMDRRTTLIQVMNPSDSALDATLDVLDQTGSMLPCPGCSGQIEASSARLWDPLVTDGLRQRPGTYGSAVVKAEAPVLAIVLESPMNDAVATPVETYAANLRRIAENCREAGAAVVVISQDIDEIMEIADRFAALNEGRLSDPVPTQGLTIDQIGLMLGGAHGMHQAEVSHVHA